MDWCVFNLGMLLNSANKELQVDLLGRFAAKKEAICGWDAV